MPEGPSLVILKEELKHFKKKTVTAASGTAGIDFDLLNGKRVTDIKTWGKHLLICFKDVTIRIHLLMFGTYRINEKKALKPKLHLEFGKEEVNFYTCAVKQIDENLEDVYDWSADVMNKNWDPKKARKKLKDKEGVMVCDALLDQTIFSGVGNIIKNEVLYRIKVHPESKTAALPAKKVNELVKEAVVYAFEFLEWKKHFTLKDHWLAHTKKMCKRCKLPLTKKYTGKTKRRSFFCENCQPLYS